MSLTTNLAHAFAERRRWAQEDAELAAMTPMERRDLGPGNAPPRPDLDALLARARHARAEAAHDLVKAASRWLARRLHLPFTGLRKP